GGETMLSGLTGYLRSHLLAYMAGLSVAVLPAVASNSASAATVSPSSADFGRFLIGKRSAPVTFTVTVGSGDRCRSPGPSGPCYPIIHRPASAAFAVGYNTLGFLNNLSFGTCYQVEYLTSSCTIMVVFEPDRPGVLRGGLAPNAYDTTLGAELTGI